MVSCQEASFQPVSPYWEILEASAYATAQPTGCKHGLDGRPGSTQMRYVTSNDL